MARGGQPPTNDPAGVHPGWAKWLLERVLISADRQTVVGDLHEEYREAAERPLNFIVRRRDGRRRRSVNYDALRTEEIECAVHHIDGARFPKNLASARKALAARNPGVSPEPPPSFMREPMQNMRPCIDRRLLR